MVVVDPFPVACPNCRKDTFHQIGWLKTQVAMSCPFCGTDKTDQLTEARLGILEAEKIDAESLASLLRGNSK